MLKKDKIISHYTTNNGLLDNQVLSIVEDELGCLWFSNNIGLTRYSPENSQFKHYGISEGLINISDLSSNTLYKGIDGKIFFCGKEGFNVFYPRLIIDDPTPPQVIIKKISLFNRPKEKLEYEGLISEFKELSLSYDQNDLNFQYVGFHYGEPLKNQYKYILESFDKNWIDAGNLRTATYTNLIRVNMFSELQLQTKMEYGMKQELQ